MIALGIAPGLPRPVADDGDLVAVLLREQHGGRPEADGMPSVRELARPAQRGVRVPADPDRDAALLPRLGHGADRAHTVEGALPIHRLAGPARAHEVQILVGDRSAPLEGLGVERLELLLEPADTRPEDDAASREHVQRRQHLGRDHGIAVGDDQHARPEPHARRLAGEVAHERQRLEVAVPPVAGELARRRVRIGRALARRDHDVVRDEDRRVAELVRLARKLDQDFGGGKRSAAGKGEAEVHGWPYCSPPGGLSRQGPPLSGGQHVNRQDKVRMSSRPQRAIRQPSSWYSKI